METLSIMLILMVGYFIGYCHKAGTYIQHAERGTPFVINKVTYRIVKNEEASK